MNETTIASARLIGEILVEGGLLTEEQLEQALAEQQTTGQRLGDILLARFDIARVDLSAALLKQLADNEMSAAAQEDLTPDEEDDDLGPPPSQRPTTAGGSLEWGSSGEPLVEGQTAGDDQLEQALQLQGGNGQHSGTFLADEDYLARRNSLSMLSRQPASAEAQHVPTPEPGQPSDDGASTRPVEETHDLATALDRLHERLEHAQLSADERLDEVEQRLAVLVTPEQLDERVHSLTSGMQELGRLSEELAGRLSSNANSQFDAVVGEVEVLRAQLADHGHTELAGVVEHVAELELRLSRAVTSAELDERLERVLTAHVTELGLGLDALRHSMTQVASSADLKRLRRTVDLLSTMTDGANELAARRLAQLEARTEQGAVAADRLQAALSETADRSAVADEQLRASLAEVADRAERRLTEERGELDARLGRELQTLQTAAAKNLASLRGAISDLTTQLAEQRRQLEAQARADGARLDGQIEQQEARAEEHAVEAARATALLEQEVRVLETELRGRLERHADRIDEQRRLLEDVRAAGEQALQAAAARLTQTITDVARDAAAATGGLKADLGQLGEQVAGQAAASSQEAAAARADLDRLRARLDDLTRRLDGHEHRTVEDTAKAQKELDDLRSGIGALGARLDVDGGTTTLHFETIRRDLGRLQSQVDQLPQKLDLLAEKTTVDGLRERVDRHEERIAASREWHHELSTELGRRLGQLGQDAQTRFDRIESDQQQASDALERASASLREEQQELAASLRTEQERSVASLRRDVSEHERLTLAGLSEHRTSLAETGVELAKVRQDVVESDRQRRQGDEWLDARIDETRGELALTLKKVAECELERRRGDDLLATRIDGLQKELVCETARADKASVAGREALRNGLALLAEQVEQRSQRTVDEVSAAVDRIERDLSDVAMRSAAQAAESQRDLRTELGRTAEAHAELLSRVDELSRSQNARLARTEEALGSLGVDELRAQVAALQGQVDRQALQARAQADAAEQLHRSFTEIESKLFERQRTFQAAGDELMSTFEALGQTIRRADEQVALSVAGPGQTFLAFAPDAENRYTMVECAGEQPAVGARIELAEVGGGSLVVTRVTDSPLPHDGRRCVYLERPS